MPPDRGSGPALLADIGGTYARFVLSTDGRLGPVTTLKATDYKGPAAAIRAFLAHAGAPPPPRAALACAGPVERGAVRLTNSGWRVDTARLGAQFGFSDVQVMNDFAAVAWAIPDLRKADLVRVGGRAPARDAPAAVFGPGTGLGVATYVPYDGGATVLVAEGGHVTMPAATDRDAEILAALRKDLGHVSAERVLSGDGLVRLYEVVARLDGIDAPKRRAAGVTEAAVAASCPASRAALDQFCAMLGTFAGDLALTVGARGGVYIAGGIVPQIADYLRASAFRERFEAKGRFREYLARIPVWVVVHPDPAFLGLARVLRAGAA